MEWNELKRFMDELEALDDEHLAMTIANLSAETTNCDYQSQKHIDNRARLEASKAELKKRESVRAKGC